MGVENVVVRSNYHTEGPHVVDVPKKIAQNYPGWWPNYECSHVATINDIGLEVKKVGDKPTDFLDNAIVFDFAHLSQQKE